MHIILIYRSYQPEGQVAHRLDAKWPPQLPESLLYVFSKTLHDQKAIAQPLICVKTLRDMDGDAQVGEMVFRHPAVDFRHREVGRGSERVIYYVRSCPALT